MAENVSSHAAWAFADAVQSLIPEDHRYTSDGIATVTNIDSDGTIWLVVPGSGDKTPVNGTILSSVSVGDVVQIKIEGGRLSIVGNSTAPSVSSIQVEERVAPVEEKADSALAEAERAHQAADAAEADASRARQAADSAESSAAQAATSASSAASSAANAESSASSAATSSAAAQTSALNAAQSASDAATSASAAQTQAGIASEAAEQAVRDAATANANAAAAVRSATQANTYASSALEQLGVVQDVVGVLSWASEHGTFTHTSDTDIVSGKVYFVHDPATGDYTPVVEPVAEDLGSYFELSVDEAMDAYVMSHLAVTSRGLWVLPNGIGSGTTPSSGETQADSDARQGSGYKMLLASGGTYIYDATGRLVRSDTAAGTDFAATRDWHVGSDDAFIFFDASEGTITLGGGSVLIGGSKTLSELVEESERAAADAQAAVKTANDVPIVTLSSTNGTTFKRNMGVSTTIVATIFTPAGRISTAPELRARFGAGAYLEWGWRDVVTDADHVLVSTDPRIIMDGFGLVVSPGDVDSQAVITCSLNY